MLYKFIFYSSGWTVGFRWTGICHYIEETAILWAQLFIKRRISLKASHSGNFSFSYVFSTTKSVFDILLMWRTFSMIKKKSLFRFKIKIREKTREIYCALMLREKYTKRMKFLCWVVREYCCAGWQKTVKVEERNLPITSINIINDTFFSSWSNQEFLFYLS